MRSPSSHPSAGDAGHDPRGAVVTFLGVVRGFSRGRNVLYLEYEAYREMAVRKLQQVADEVREKWTIDDIAILHRVGHLEVGERRFEDLMWRNGDL